jgi:hypothetical protein
MARFEVFGPCEVGVQKNNAGRIITKNEIKDFWETFSHLRNRKGCYVFGFHAAKGMKPMYVGKATKSFKGEVFQPHKLNKYYAALSKQSKGTPVLFFVCAPLGKGAPNKNQIGEIESFLIQAGLAANRALLNEKDTKPETWSIAGVVRGQRGKPSQAAQDFKKLMNL